MRVWLPQKLLPCGLILLTVLHVTLEGRHDLQFHWLDEVVFGKSLISASERLECNDLPCPESCASFSSSSAPVRLWKVRVFTAAGARSRHAVSTEALLPGFHADCMHGGHIG